MGNIVRYALLAVWNTIGIFVGVAGLLLVIFIIGGGPAIGLVPIASTIVYAVLVFGFFIAIRKDSATKFRAAFTIQPIPSNLHRHVLLATAAALVLAPCLAIVNRRIFPDQVHPPDPIDALLELPLGWLPFVILTLLIAPLTEELVNRGWLQRKLERWWGASVAIAMTSVFFGLCHMVLWKVPYHSLVGAIFGYAVYATRSVWTGVILHMAFNTSLVVLSFLISEEVFETWLNPTGMGVLIAPAGVLLGGGALIYLDWSRRALTAPDAPSPPSSASVLA